MAGAEFGKKTQISFPYGRVELILAPSGIKFILGFRNIFVQEL